MSTVVGSTGGRGTHAIKTDFPETSGLILGTSKLEGRQIALVAEDVFLQSDLVIGLNE